MGRAASLMWSWGDGTIATNVSYFTSHVWTNAGMHTVTFTAYNNDHPGGVSTSVMVDLTPLNVPQLQGVLLSTNGFQFQFTGQSSALYIIQYATNLLPPMTWQFLQFIPNSSDGAVQITDPPTNVARFYRVLAQ
jgi:hypothetical protein